VPDGRQLIVAVFEDEAGARDAVVRASELKARGHAEIHDACLVLRRADGQTEVVETSDIAPKKAALYGGAWALVGGALVGIPVVAAALGATAGAIVARRRDVGITDAWEREVADQLAPGRTAVVVLVDRSGAPDVVAAAERLGAWTSAVDVEV
jgi:uncharacterized membrane protein